jgi:glutamate carboxypeptidase
MPPDSESSDCHATSETAARIQNALQDLMPEAMEWLKTMVDINSFTNNPAGVNRLGELTAKCFESLGFAPDFVPSEDAAHGRHLFLSKGDKQKTPVVLVTHLDTVFPPEEEVKNTFHWREARDEARIYGPGVVDIKGGTALIWMMLSAMREHMPALFENTHWIIAANASEEVIGAEFSHRLSERAPRGARLVLVFEGGPREGSTFHLVTERKGRTVYRIKSTGKGAHAGSSHAEGVNAITALCESVRAASEMTNYEQGLTVNVGRIEGGTVVNRVPQEAIAELEVRAFDPLRLAEARMRLESLAAGPGRAEPPRIDIEILGDSPSWPLKQCTSRLVRVWEQTARNLGLNIKAVARGGLSDANYLHVLGPTLDGLGPSGGNAHCSERSADGSKIPEFVDTHSFVPKALLNILSLERFLSDTLPENPGS